MPDLSLVLGGGGALGTAIVETLRARGDEVLAPSRDALDLTDPDAVEAFWDALERPPRWVANAAGGFRGGTVAETEPEQLRLLHELNVATAFWTCRAAARRMRGGAIVNVAAEAGRSGGRGKAAYALTKAAVIRLSEVLALELAAQGVRVNAVAPALIDTPANREAGLTGGTPPAQVAAAVAFLLSDGAAAVTGAVVPV